MMTPRTEVILYALIVFIALEFFLLSFFVFLMKQRLKQTPPACACSHADRPPVDFKWPDQVRLEYTDAAGNVVADRVFKIERPN